MMSKSEQLLKKITILGKYYDTFLYSGKLYLVRQDATLNVFDWNKFIDNISTDDFAFDCCYKDSRFLYNPYLSKFYSDDDFKDLLQKKIYLLNDVSIDEEEFNKFKINKKTSKLKVIPNDLLIYKKELYLASSEGVTVHKIKRSGYNGEYAMSKNEATIFNHDTVNIFGQKGNVYFSCLNNGLYVYRQFNLDDFLEEETEDSNQTECVKKITEDYVSFAKSNFSSLFAGSYHSKSKLYVNEYLIENEKVVSSRISEIKDMDSLFSSQNKKSFFISSYDKIYRLSEDGIHLVKYTQSPSENESHFSLPLIISNEFIDVDDIVSSSVELFGLIVEFKDKISIITSENTTITLKFEKEALVNYRTFPYSKFYKNQLHLVFENRMEILSLNHDFLINQKDKKFGIRYATNDYLRDAKPDE